MKKKMIFAASLLLVMVMLSSCGAIVARLTGPIIEDYLMDQNDGPIKVIDKAMDGLLENMVAGSLATASIEDYDWKLKEGSTSISASVGDPPRSTSGIVSARNIKIEYDYTVIGDPTPNNEDLTEIEKPGSLTILIEEIKFNADTEKLVSITPAHTSNGDDAPVFEDLEFQSDPLKISASVGNIDDGNPKASLAVGLNNPISLEIENESVDYESNNSITSQQFGVLAGVNRAVLSDPGNEETGISFKLFLFNP